MPIYPPSQSLVPLLLTQVTSRRRHHRQRRYSLTYDDHLSHAKTNFSSPSSPTSPQSTDQVVWSFGGDSEVEDDVEDDVKHEDDVKDEDEHEVDDEDEHNRDSMDEQRVLESDNEIEDGSSLDSESDESESDSSSLSLTYLTDGEDENNDEPSLDPVDPSSLDPADPVASATTTTTTTESLDDLRQASSQRLAQAWKDIFERYEGRSENEPDDEIDLMTGEIIVDQGFLRDQEKTLFGTMTRLGLELKGPQEEERERLRKADRIARRRSNDRQLNHLGAGMSNQRSPPSHRGRNNEAHHRNHGLPHQMYGGEDFDNLLFVPKDSEAAPSPDISKRFSTERSKSPEKITDVESDFPQSSASDWDGEEDEDWDQHEEEEKAEQEPAVSPVRVFGRPTASDTLPFQRESSVSSSHSGSLEERMALISRRRSRMMPKTVALADSLFSKRPPSSLVRSISPSPPLPSVSTPMPGWSSPSRFVPETAGSIRPSTATATTVLTGFLLARSVKRKHNHMEDEDMLQYDQEDEAEEEKEDTEENDLFGFTPSPSPPHSPPPSSHPGYFTTPTKKQRQEGQFNSFGMFSSSSHSTATAPSATTTITAGVLTTPRTALAKTIDLLSLQSPPPSFNRASLPPLPPLPPLPSLSLLPISSSSSAASVTPLETMADNQQVFSTTPAPPTCGGPGFCTKDFCFKCM